MNIYNFTITEPLTYFLLYTTLYMSIIPTLINKDTDITRQYHERLVPTALLHHKHKRSIFKASQETIEFWCGVYNTVWYLRAGSLLTSLYLLYLIWRLVLSDHTSHSTSITTKILRVLVSQTCSRMSITQQTL